MKVNEIFNSVQGEGITTGYLTTFIRFTGCNLRCLYCDTKYAYEEGREMTVTQIMEMINGLLPCVLLTGGEPLYQNAKELRELAKLLKAANRIVVLETNGSIPLPTWSCAKNVITSMDIKTPSSGMNSKMCWSNIQMLTKKDQLKFIISDKRDIDFTIDVLEKYTPMTNIILQPTSNDTVVANEIVNTMKQRSELRMARLMLQMHKCIWGMKRGV